MRDACHAVVNRGLEQGYPVATLPGEQRLSGRKPLRTIDTFA